MLDTYYSTITNQISNTWYTTYDNQSEQSFNPFGKLLLYEIGVFVDTSTAAVRTVSTTDGFG